MYPQLHRKALDEYYSPTSDTPETTFSCGRRAISCSRAEFKPGNVKFSYQTSSLRMSSFHLIRRWGGIDSGSLPTKEIDFCLFCLKIRVGISRSSQCQSLFINTSYFMIITRLLHKKLQYIPAVEEKGGGPRIRQVSLIQLYASQILRISKQGRYSVYI